MYGNQIRSSRHPCGCICTRVCWLIVYGVRPATEIDSRDVFFLGKEAPKADPFGVLEKEWMSSNKQLMQMPPQGHALTMLSSSRRSCISCPDKRSIFQSKKRNDEKLPRTVRLNKVLGSLRIRNPERNAASPVRVVNRPRETVKNGQNHVAKSVFCPKINQKRSFNERFLLEYEGFSSRI